MTEITRHALSTVAWNQASACAPLRFGIPRSPKGNRCGAIGVGEANGQEEHVMPMDLHMKCIPLQRYAICPPSFAGNRCPISPYFTR